MRTDVAVPRRPLIALLAAVLACTALTQQGGRQPAAAEPAAAPASVTLVGSLQSELGCPSDWSPDCAATHLSPGSDGVWSGTFQVPAGSHELKVAIDDSWDESYGAEGGGNLPLVLAGAARIVFTYDQSTHRIGVQPADLGGTEVTAEDRALAGDSLRAPLTRERFYFVMADRFANGDRANDRGGIPGDRLAHGFDPTDKGFFHGGDVAGLSKKLDYIDGLGTTAIWLTPSFENRPVQGSGAAASAGYHGYWVTDFTRIDPHFGTNAELTSFIERAHARGIKVFFDIITNHTADVIDYAEGAYTYIDKATEPYRDATGTPFDDRDHLTGPFPAMDPATSFPRTPVFRTEADRTVKVPAWLNDPTNYHNRGDSTYAGESSTYGDFGGLDDLFTEQPDVVEGMTDIYKSWVDFGIDGFRIDTVKHVNLEFWQQFAPAIREHAAAIGNDDFFAFGEVFDGNPSYLSTFTTEGRLDATLDFGFQGAGLDFAKGLPTTRLRSFYASDDLYTDTDSNAYSLPTFLGNHDMGRIGGFLDDTFSGDELLRRDELAHALMYLTRGQPVVYYGDEQGFTGDGGDKDARQDMFASSVASYNDDDLIGTSATTATDSYRRGHPLYRTIASLAELREKHPALADGAQVHRYASNGAGVYAFSRIAAGENREYVVAVNNATTAKTVSFATFVENGELRQLWPGTHARLRADDEARVTVTVPPLSAVVYRAADRLPARSDAPAVLFDNLSAGGVVGPVGERAEVAAAVPAGGFNQVSFAWRPVGGDSWQRLGTDDNAPYRVFHDLGDLPRHTMLEYRAVLRDSSGNLSATSTWVTVGDPAAGEPGGPGGPVTQPANVSMPGSHNSEIGCPGDWQPECDQAQMTLDANSLVWTKKVTLPEGDYEYKAAINKSWDENYGKGAALNGPNIPLGLATGRDVTFYYDHASHWATTDAEGPIVTAPGSFQSELGCSADWQPDCMRSWLKDPDGDGTYTLTASLPAGSYETKVAHGLSWDENYGAGGAPGGGNIAFSMPGGVDALFSYDLATHVLTVSTRAAGATPDLTQAKAQWLRRGVVAWDVPDAAARHYRLHWSGAGDLAVDAEDVTGGSSVPLTYDPAGLPPDVLADFPHLAGYEAFRLRPQDLDKVPQILQGQLAVASYDPSGALFDATGVQVPGVLDDVYAAAASRTLGVSWSKGKPTVTVWAPTAQDVDLRVWPTKGAARSVSMQRHADGTWSVSGPPSWSGASYLFDVRVWSPSAGALVRNEVTDPYSVALTTNSQRSLMADLDDDSLEPAGWASLRAPAIAKPEDRTVYELHVRDFSIGDASVPAAERGTYLAFTRAGSAGMRHLRRLADAGLNTVHLLPAFDIATIEERRAAQATPACDLAVLRHPTPSSSRTASTGCARATASTGATTRCTTPRPRARTRPTPKGPGARWSSDGWCRRSTGPGSRWSWTWSTTTRRPPGRTPSPCWTGSCPATTTGSTPAAVSRTRRAAPTPRPSTR